MRTNLIIIVKLSFTLIFFSGCNSQSSEKISNYDTGISYDTNNNNFETFFQKFKEDSIFQRSRIKFPLIKEHIVEDTDEPNTVIDSIDSLQWSYISLKYDSTFATRRIDAYTEKIMFSKDTAHLFYMGVDNGINVEFIFLIEDNKWYLIRWNDLSN